jgi:hypothetical protein
VQAEERALAFDLDVELLVVEDRRGVGVNEEVTVTSRARAKRQ